MNTKTKLTLTGSWGDRRSEKRLKHPRDTFGASMVEGATFDPDHDMPLIRADSFVPTALVPFSVAKRSDWNDFDCAVHFCERDQDIEPFWSNPTRYIPKLKKFEGVIGLDFSTCVDFPRALKVWNAYRNRASVYKLQTSGIPSLPLLRGDPDIIDQEIAGLEQGCAFAVSPRGCVREVDDRKRFERDLKYLIDALEPSTIISYGANSFGVLEYAYEQGVEVYEYASRGRGSLGGGDLSVQIQ